MNYLSVYISVKLNCTYLYFKYVYRLFRRKNTRLNFLIWFYFSSKGLQNKFRLFRLNLKNVGSSGEGVGQMYMCACLWEGGAGAYVKDFR